MAKIVRLRLTGRAEKFIEDIGRTGLSEREIIAKALWLLEMAWTNRVAVFNADGDPEYILTIHPIAEEIASAAASAA